MLTTCQPLLRVLCVDYLLAYHHPEGTSITVLTLHVRNWHRKGKELAQGHKIMRARAWIQTEVSAKYVGQCPPPTLSLMNHLLFYSL